MNHFVAFVHSVHLEALSQLQASTRHYIPHIRNKGIAVIRLILAERGSPNCSPIRMHLLARLETRENFIKNPTEVLHQLWFLQATIIPEQKIKNKKRKIVTVVL